MISDKLKQRLQEQKSRIGLVGSSLHIYETEDAKHNVEAFIKPANWDITLKVRAGFNPIQDKRQKAYARAKKISDGLELLLTDVLAHECGHWELPHGSGRGCPYDVFNHDLITEAVKNGLPQDKKAHAGYVANLFEDIVDNANCNAQRGGFGGQVLFWDHEGFACKQEGRDSYTPVYEAFVKLNMHVWGDNLDRALVKRHYSNEKRVDDAVSKIVKDLNLVERTKDLRPLFDKKRWSSMAQTLARHIAPLLDVSPQERPSAYSREKGEGNGSQSDQDPITGNGIEQRARTEEGKEDIAYGRYTGGKGPSPEFTTQDQLHALYSRIARDISVKVESMTRSDQLPVAPLTLRPFNPEQDDPRAARLNRLYITDEDELTVAHQRQPLVITAREKMQRKSFPDFKLVVVDTSASMKDAADGSRNVGSTTMIPWGDRSKYHFALLGFYGVENFIRKQGIAPFIRHGAALFSSGTRYKEAGFEDIESVYRHVLSPDWGGTSLDAKALTDALKGRESFTLSISDGEIENWSGERDAFKKAVAGQHYAHIQIGGNSEFSRDLEGWNTPVYYVRDASDLPKLMINAARRTYGRFTRT